MRDLFLGIDCSTSAVKALVFDAQGKCRAAGKAPLTLSRLQPGWHEQKADDWWLAACHALQACLKEVDPQRLTGLSLSVQRETFVPVDDSGNPLRQAIVWMDTRAAAQRSALAQMPELHDFQQCTGKPLSVNLAPPKLRWLAENETALFERAAQFWDVHAYLCARFCRTAVSSWGSACPLGLLDLRSMNWHPAALSASGISARQLPRLAAPAEQIGQVSLAAARESGLPAGLPLFAGIGDGQACGMGAGILQSGLAYLSLGTSVISGTFAPRFTTSDAFRTMVGGARGSYLLETVLLGGTYTIDWFLQDLLEKPRDLAALTREARDIAPGSEGLLVLPYWNGAMNPYWDEQASGVMIGWRGLHRPAHVLRAILEGIAYELHLQSLAVERALGSRAERFVVMGGGSRNELWCQIIADVSGRSLQRAAEQEAAALGAAMLAALGSGAFASASQAASAMARGEEKIFQPQAASHERYARLFEKVYHRLYPSLRELFPFLRES